MPVIGGAELSLCYLSVRDEVYEKLMKLQEERRHLKVIFIYLLSLRGGGFGAQETSPPPFDAVLLCVMTKTWREGCYYRSQLCKIKTKIINNVFVLFLY